MKLKRNQTKLVDVNHRDNFLKAWHAEENWPRPGDEAQPSFPRRRISESSSGTQESVSSAEENTSSSSSGVRLYYRKVLLGRFRNLPMKTVMVIKNMEAQEDHMQEKALLKRLEYADSQLYRNL